MLGFYFMLNLLTLFSYNFFLFAFIFFLIFYFMLNLLTFFSYKIVYLLAFYFNARVLLHAEFIDCFQLQNFLFACILF